MPKSFFKRIQTLINYSNTGGLIFLFFGILIKSLIEVIGVASISPFLSVILNPEIIQTNPYLNFIFSYFHFESTTSFLNSLGILTIFLLLLTNFISSIVEWMIIRYSKFMEYRLSTQLLKKYIYNDYLFFVENNSSNLGKNIITEVQRSVDGIIFPVFIAISRLVTVAFLLILLVLVEPIAAFSMSLLFGGSYFLIYLLIKKKLFTLGKLSSEAMMNRFKTINEAFLGIKDIKLRSIENRFISRYEKSAKKLASYTIYQHVASILPRYLLESFAFCGIVLVMMFLVNGGKNSQSIIPIVALYAVAGYKLIPALQNIYSSIVTIKFNTAALIILSDDLSEEMSSKQPSTNGVKIDFKYSLTLKSVGFSYPNSKKSAIKDININIKPNTTIGIVGLSGAGKTTLVDLILGLLEKNHGKLLIDNVEITEKNINSWRRNIGYMPQDTFLIDDTISANIAFGLPSNEQDLKKVMQAAKIAELHDFIISLPHKYETIVGEHGIKMSGGQRQRLGIARVMYNNPKVIVLDEGTSAVDMMTETSLMKSIKEVSNNKTIILIAHRLSTVQDCDNIYLLNDGKIEDSGTYNELLLSSERFKKMIGEKI